MTMPQNPRPFDWIQLGLVYMAGLCFFLAGCGSAPVMEKKIAIWNGAPEKAGICRMTQDAVSKQSGYSKPLVAKVFSNNGEIVCIEATDPAFARFGAMTFDDIGVLQRYIETLLNRCEKWKP